MRKYEWFWLRIARLKCFFQDSHVRIAAFFNIVFVYIWGYLLWGTTDVGTTEWWVEEFGHLLWSGFHTWISISYIKHHDKVVFSLWRWKEERIVWWRIILFSVFGWEGLELWHDNSGFFTTIAQLGNTDTMTDIFLSGFLGPFLVIAYRRWADGIRLFFTDPRTKIKREHNLRIAYEALRLVAEQSSGDDLRIMQDIANLARKEWREKHHLLPVVKSLYGVLRGSKRERRKRRKLIREMNHPLNA